MGISRYRWVLSSRHVLRLFEVIIQIDEHGFATKMPLKRQGRLYFYDGY